MNLDPEKTPRDEMEIRITALLLGELAPEEAAALRQAISQNPELQQIYQRLAQTIELVTAASSTSSESAEQPRLRLGEEKRQELLQRFKTVSPKEFKPAVPKAKTLARWVPYAIAACFVVLVGSRLLPELSRAKSKGQTHGEVPFALLPNGRKREELAEADPNAFRRQYSIRSKDYRTPAVQSASGVETRGAVNFSKAATDKPAKPQEWDVTVSGVTNGWNYSLNGSAPFSTTAGTLALSDSPAAGKTTIALPSGGSSVVLTGLTTNHAGDLRSWRHDDFDHSMAFGANPALGAAAAQTLQTEVAPRGFDLAWKENHGAQTFSADHDLSGSFPGATINGGSYDASVRFRNLSQLDDIAALDPAGPATELGVSRKPSSKLSLSSSEEERAGERRPFIKSGSNSLAVGAPTVVTAPAPLLPSGQASAGYDFLFEATGTKQKTDSKVFLPRIAAETPIGGKGGDDYGDFFDSRGADVNKGLESQKQKEHEIALINGDLDGDLRRLLRNPAGPTDLERKDGVSKNEPPLGNVPLLGRLFSGTASNNGRGIEIVTAAEGEKKPSLRPEQENLSLSERGERLKVPSNVYSLEVAGYTGANRRSYAALDPELSKIAEEKKRDLSDQERFAQTLRQKLQQETIDQNMPKSAKVDLMEPAVAGRPTFWDRITGNVGATAHVQVQQAATDVKGFERRTLRTYDPYFVQDEFQTIKSPVVLGKVVDELKLRETWSAQTGKPVSQSQAIKKLQDKLDLKPVQNTTFVAITAKDSKPDEAAKIANAVAKAYKDFRREEAAQFNQSGLQMLHEKLEEQEKKIAAAKEELARLETKSEPTKTEQADVPLPKRPVNAPIPQPEIQTRENAWSTFSLNVSDVSFKLASASLEKGVLPDPAGIRSEEFINAFDYRDPEPAAGTPLAFAWDRARYPFAQNRDLLRFSIKTAAQGRQSGRPLNLVLMLDTSGSMERADRVQIVREALKVLAAQLTPQDKFSVVTFARTARLWVDGVPGNEAAKVSTEAAQLTPEGGTNLEDAMNLAYQTALQHYVTNGINRVVMLTDGAANLGNVAPEELKKKVEANRKQGIALDCFGVGWEGFNDDLLEVLSRNGDGRYGFINSPEEASTHFASQLAGALQVAASDVKVQIEFNPKRVTTYRQIGYARHQLTKEQFRDNTVDAAEIGAAESGNALYTIEVNLAGEGPLAIVRVRYKVPGTSDYKEHEWTVPFSGNAAPLDQAAPALRLAATASAFSEWLAGSQYAAEVTPDKLISLMNGVPEVFGKDERPQKLEWMIRQAKSLGAK
jgi:secreted protein with Ig-like and vWFA domain